MLRRMRGDAGVDVGLHLEGSWHHWGLHFFHLAVLVAAFVHTSDSWGEKRYCGSGNSLAASQPGHIEFNIQHSTLSIHVSSFFPFPTSALLFNIWVRIAKSHKQSTQFRVHRFRSLDELHSQ